MDQNLYQATPLTIGDVVRLKSGAPPSMTVISINSDEIETCWGTKSGAVRREKFPAAALEINHGKINLFDGSQYYDDREPVNSTDEVPN